MLRSEEEDKGIGAFFARATPWVRSSLS